MPNWCFNRLEVFGPADAVVDFTQAVASEESLFDFEHILPTPPELIARAESEPTPERGLFPDWLGWRLANWGTKWNASDPRRERGVAPVGRRRECYEFSTAWNPPMPLLEHLVARHRDLGFALFYSDEQLNFIGVARWSNGRFIHGESVDDEAAQEQLGGALFGAAEPRIDPVGPTVSEALPRWEDLVDSERLFLPTECDRLPTIRLRINADRRVWQRRGQSWLGESRVATSIPAALWARIDWLRRRNPGDDLLPLEVELCEVAQDGAPGALPQPGERRTRLLVDVHEIGGRSLADLPYAERRQLRAELAARLAGPAGTHWFDLADPRLAEWTDGRGRPILVHRLETDLASGLPAARRRLDPAA